MTSIGYGDKVAIVRTGQIGVITRDRMSGLYDVSIELLDPNIEPLQEQIRNNRAEIVSGGTVVCCHPTELELLKSF